MHLHARRLIIKEPTGSILDVTLICRNILQQAWISLVLKIEMSTAEPLREDSASQTSKEKKQAAKAYAKQYRKTRRGERRSRTNIAQKLQAHNKPKRLNLGAAKSDATGYF